ncbi:MAG: response regulator [Candidatus Tectimicrobiota bacterium]
MSQILIVDDDAMMRDRLRQMFERRGYDVHEAATGMEGLQAYCSEPTDLVITDLQMPTMNGLQMMQHLREAFPAIKMIAISGAPHLLSEAHALATHTFLKPVALHPLLRAVEELVAQDDAEAL